MPNAVAIPKTVFFSAADIKCEVTVQVVDAEALNKWDVHGGSLSYPEPTRTSGGAS